MADITDIATFEMLMNASARPARRTWWVIVHLLNFNILTYYSTVYCACLLR
jgi:hypothetical protein